MIFNAHNISLGNSKRTMTGSEALLVDTDRWKSIERTVNLLFTKEEIKNKRVVDLGCLEGGYSLAFAQLGFQVIGMDARQDNLDKCEWVKTHYNVPNLTYVLDDVKNLANHGTFDLIFCAGLLYHLDEPAKFIEIMAKQCTTCTIIHTHFALHPDSFYDNRRNLNLVQRSAKKLFNLPNYHYHAKHDFWLSEVVENEGYKGRWFYEFDENESKQSIEKNFAASYSNYKSFWFVKSELIKCARKNNFKVIYEQFDFVDKNIGEDYIEKFDRGMFVLIK